MLQKNLFPVIAVLVILCVGAGAMTLISFDEKNTVESEFTLTSVAEDPNYWDQGLADVASYSLTQNRYRDNHPGEVVLIFVKEDFLLNEQIKNESYDDRPSTPVLKNIVQKKFTTGIYDYTLSTNVFYPLDQNKYPGVEKIQHVSTEWCGTVYVQLNKQDDNYLSTMHSYFEREGDQKSKVAVNLLEDELFNLIRTNPENLPTGTMTIIPSMEFHRFSHKPLQAVKARAKLSDYMGDDLKSNNVSVYSIEFDDHKRSLQIYFDKSFPHMILGWDETRPSAFDKRSRTTTARLKHFERLAYWGMNDAADAMQRKKFDIMTYD